MTKEEIKAAYWDDTRAFEVTIDQLQISLPPKISQEDARSVTDNLPLD